MSPLIGLLTHWQKNIFNSHANRLRLPFPSYTQQTHCPCHPFDPTLNPTSEPRCKPRLSKFRGRGGNSLSPELGTKTYCDLSMEKNNRNEDLFTLDAADLATIMPNGQWYMNLQRTQSNSEYSLLFVPLPLKVKFISIRTLQQKQEPEVSLRNQILRPAGNTLHDLRPDLIWTRWLISRLESLQKMWQITLGTLYPVQGGGLELPSLVPPLKRHTTRGHLDYIRHVQVLQTESGQIRMRSSSLVNWLRIAGRKLSLINAMHHMPI